VVEGKEEVYEKVRWYGEGAEVKKTLRCAEKREEAGMEQGQGKVIGKMKGHRRHVGTCGKAGVDVVEDERLLV
jgi:hypothetical protein